MKLIALVKLKYCTEVERFKQSGQHYPYFFHSFLHHAEFYVIYVHCFVENYPHLKEDITRAQGKTHVSQRWKGIDDMRPHQW